MNAELMVAAAGWSELALFCLGAYIGFFRWKYTIAEAGAYSIITVLMGLSFLFQVCFLIGIPRFALTVESICALIALAWVIRRRQDARSLITSFMRFARFHKAALSILAVALIYLACQNLLLPPATHHWPTLGKVLRIQQEGLLTHRVDVAAGPFLDPLNAAALAHLFLRFGSDYGLGILGFLGYLAIAFSGYALSRRYAWPPIAFTVTLIVVSMPRLVCHAATPGVGIIPASASLFCLLAVHRLSEQPNLRDLLLLLLGILFSISVGKLGVLFPLLLALLSGALMLQRHGVVFWWAMVRNSWKWLLAALPVAVVLSQSWLFAYNLHTTGEWVGSPEIPVFEYNSGGILGTAANSIRYLLESVDLTQPIDALCRWSFGFSPIDFLQALYRATLAPLFGRSGATASYSISWVPNDVLAWFGPFGILTVLPAIGYAAWRGPRRLKTIAIALIGYFYTVCLIAGWAPGNATYFLQSFVCGGICVAFLLPPWRMTQVRRRVLQTLCFVLLAYALVFNTTRPAIATDWLRPAPGGSTPISLPQPYHLLIDPIRSCIWTLSDFGRDRWLYARQLFGDERVAVWSNQIPAGSRVTVVARNPSLAYPLWLLGPKTHVTVISPDGLQDTAALKRLAPDFLAYLDCAPIGLASGATHTTIWLANAVTSRFPGALVKIQPHRIH